MRQSTRKGEGGRQAGRQRHIKRARSENKNAAQPKSVAVQWARQVLAFHCFFLRKQSNSACRAGGCTAAIQSRTAPLVAVQVSLVFTPVNLQLNAHINGNVKMKKNILPYCEVALLTADNDSDKDQMASAATSAARTFSCLFAQMANQPLTTTSIAVSHQTY